MQFAVAAAVGGSFSVWEAGLEFVLAASGGVAIGLAVGWLMAQVRKRIEDPPVEITMSLFTGYLVTLVFARVQKWPVVVPACLVLGGLGAALVVGAVGGILPALRAARLSPARVLAAD